jgi:hypothetical protein
MNTKYQAVRHVKVRSADERKGYTSVFKRLVPELPRYMTICGIARYLWVSWDLIPQQSNTMPSEEAINWQQIHKSGAHPDTLTDVFRYYLYRTTSYS